MRAPHRIAVALLVLAGTVQAVPAGESVRSVLVARDHDDRTRDEVLGELVALGPSAVPDLYDLFAGEGDAVFGADEETRWWGRPDRYAGLAEEALAALPAEPVLKFVGQHADTPDGRQSGLRLLGRRASADGLPLFVALVRSTPELHWGSRPLREECIDALAAIIRSDPSAVPGIVASAEQLDERLSLVIAASARRAAVPASLRVFSALLGRWPSVDAETARGIGELADRYAWRAPRAARSLESLLQSKHPEVRTAAVIALGRLRDWEALPEIIRTVEDFENGPRNAARSALREVSGLSAPETRGEWEAWHEGELVWWDEKGSELLKAIDADDPVGTARAIRELETHPIVSRRLALRIAEILPDADERVVPDLCRTLERLDCRRAVPGLVEVLDSSDVPARGAATRALHALTGEDFPGQPSLWRAYLSS